MITRRWGEEVPRSKLRVENRKQYTDIITAMGQLRASPSASLCQVITAAARQQLLCHALSPEARRTSSS